MPKAERQLRNNKVSSAVGRVRQLQHRKLRQGKLSIVAVQTARMDYGMVTDQRRELHESVANSWLRYRDGGTITLSLLSAQIRFLVRKN